MSEQRESLIYLASPYSDPDPSVMDRRAVQVASIAGHLMKHGLLVYSPIVHGHTIKHATDDLPTSWQYWQRHCLRMIDTCDRLVVVMLSGWMESVGVRAEMKFACDVRGMTPEFFDPVALTLNGRSFP